MFNHRANRFEQEADRYSQRGNTKKADWAKKQAEDNREKANQYKGKDGW